MNPKIELAACILGPLALSITLLHCIYWALNYHNTTKSATYKKLNIFTLDADRGLAEQGYLWLSILTPAIYFIVFGTFAWNGYSPSLTSEGFSEFIRISALPIALLSLSIPLTVLVARVHATHQTSVQIATTRHKNNIDAYYAHRKAMFEYFGSLKEIEYSGAIKGDFYAHPRLHLRFFIDKGPNNGTPEINKEKFKSAIKTITEIQNHINIALTRKEERRVNIENYAQACTKIFELATILNLPCIYENLKSHHTEFNICWDSSDSEENDLKFNAVGKSTEQLIGAYRYTRSFLRVLCEFAGYDVSFFDKKEYPAIDKGSDYKTKEYHSMDIEQRLYNIVESSRIRRSERWEKEREKKKELA